MTLRRNATSIVLVAALGTGAALSLRQSRATAPSTLDAILEAPTLPSSVKRILALGFHSLAADLDYLQAIQIFGDRSYNRVSIEERQRRSLVMVRLIEDTTELDPRFNYAYIFAANAIPVARPDGTLLNLEETLALLRKGVKNGGKDWRLPFYLSYYLSSYQGDLAGAAEAMAEAARRPNHPEYVPLLATRLAAAGGSIDMGIQFARAMVDQAASDDDRVKFQERLQLLEMEKLIREIETALRTYVQRNGHSPERLDELVSTGILSALPEEPHGGTWIYEPEKLSIRSSAAQRLKLPDSVEREIEQQRMARQKPFWERTP